MSPLPALLPATPLPTLREAKASLYLLHKQTHNVLSTKVKPCCCRPHPSGAATITALQESVKGLKCAQKLRGGSLKTQSKLL
eukprot:647697-Pelagomonas_calceolata.AAC.7